jgi:hypothetical protein
LPNWNKVITSGSDASLSNLNVSNSSTAPQFVGDGSQLTGIIGVQGSTGAQGTTGSQGTTGVQGTTGSQGIIGSQGTTGPIGSNGPQGTTGIQGTTGDDGSTGPQGTTGPTGETGVQGTTGTTSIQGTTGTQGTTGNQGTTGDQGTTGLQGVQGTTGGGGDAIGDIKTSSRSLDATYLLSDGTAYLQSSYPTLYGLVGLLPYGVGEAWSTVATGITYGIYAVGYGNGVWLIADQYSNIRKSTNNGLTWSGVTSGRAFAGAIYSVAYGNGVWLADGYNTGVYDPNTDTYVSSFYITRSTDNGTTWSEAISGIDVIETGVIVSVAYGNSVWIAVGYYVYSSNYYPYLLRSTDNGVNWAGVYSGFDVGDFMQCVAYGNSVWIIVGANGKMIRSTNGGANWSLVTSGFGTTRIVSVAYGNGVWVAVGYSGTITRSTDNGITWNAVTSGFSTTNIQSVSYGNGIWVAVGQSGKVSRSTNNGVTWNAVTSGVTTSLRSVANNSNIWIAGANDSTSIIRSTYDYDITTLFKVPKTNNLLTFSNAYIKATT